MKIESKKAITASLLYLAFCLCLKLLSFEGSWGGLLMFLLALPFSLPSLWVSNKIGGEPLFIALNSVGWWLAVRIFYGIKAMQRREK